MIYVKSTKYFLNPLTARLEKLVTQSGGEPVFRIVQNSDTSGKLAGIRAIYPMMDVMHSDKLTFTFHVFPERSVIGEDDPVDPTGFRSFVKPVAKPLLLDHIVSGRNGFVDGSPVKPIGRILYAEYVKGTDDWARVPAKVKGVDLMHGGSGAVRVVGIIASEEGVRDVLSGALHTVSVGVRASKVVESISGVDIIPILTGESTRELPPYRPGTLYDVDGEKRLSFLSVNEWRGLEISFVNSPADDLARVVDPDIGLEGLRFLIAQKKRRSAHYKLFDLVTEAEVLDTERLAQSAGFHECILSDIVDSVDALAGGVFVSQDKFTTEMGSAGPDVIEEDDLDEGEDLAYDDIRFLLDLWEGEGKEIAIEEGLSLQNNSGYLKGLPVDMASGWSFGAADGNRLIEKGGMSLFARVHLARRTDADPKTKAAYAYPVAKLKGSRVTLFRRGVIAAKSRAAQQGAEAVVRAADRLLKHIDSKVKSSVSGEEWILYNISNAIEEIYDVEQ